MVPISTRTADDKSNSGNQVSNMLIQLATNVADPIERLEAIHENTVRGKAYQNAIGAKNTGQYGGCRSVRYCQSGGEGL